ncbi:hypothetical protein [Microbacterium sp. W4I20]|uniref:hypothetical protein n=1 Tax=Microbacterium sp. W4I20 TaxID=3042262 RepID=UPI00278A751D|nr:hypothetical protein [Microbacterium sp. W4I20]MDQ0725699.1 hypothetical protein [Microbacterium sp. W4I20]
MDTNDKTREIRLRRAAQRQGLSLHKSRSRDPRAIGHGLFHIADGNNTAVAGHGLTGHEMSLDDVEVYLADAQDFDVHFENFTGHAELEQTRPFLWWQEHYRLGNRTFSGWMLAEPADSPRDHFIGAGRCDLAYAALKARAVLSQWAEDSGR